MWTRPFEPFLSGAAGVFFGYEAICLYRENNMEGVYILSLLFAVALLLTIALVLDIRGQNKLLRKLMQPIQRFGNVIPFRRPDK